MAVETINHQDRLKLKSVQLNGYKSIDGNGQKVHFGDISLLIGANGSGKSNLMSFFQMLNYMMTGALQQYIGERGSADAFLYYGAKETQRISATVTFADSINRDTYQFSLAHAARDTLIFAEEAITWQSADKPKPYEIVLDPGQRESGLLEFINRRNRTASDLTTAKLVYTLLRGCQVFHFHDTSLTARVRNNCYLNDNRFLRSDAGNLAAFLYRLEQNELKYYERIVRYVRKILPQFKDFRIEPLELNQNYTRLDWHDKSSDYLFGPHQISDGSLRFIALAALLLQPERSLPQVIILDEPELGLHPSAIHDLAAMIQRAGQFSQVILATQSVDLVDQFDADRVVTVDWDNDASCSVFRSHTHEDLAVWLDNYALGEA